MNESDHTRRRWMASVTSIGALSPGFLLVGVKNEAEIDNDRDVGTIVTARKAHLTLTGSSHETEKSYANCDAVRSVSATLVVIRQGLDDAAIFDPPPMAGMDHIVQ